MLPEPQISLHHHDSPHKIQTLVVTNPQDNWPLRMLCRIGPGNVRNSDNRHNVSFHRHARIKLECAVTTTVSTGDRCTVWLDDPPDRSVLKRHKGLIRHYNSLSVGISSMWTGNYPGRMVMRLLRLTSDTPAAPVRRARIIFVAAAGEALFQGVLDATLAWM